MRTRGGQRKRFKDAAKHYMKKGQIDISAWELMAVDRPLWRRNIYHMAKFETNRLCHEMEKWHRERRGRCLNIFMSPFHLAPPAHTATRPADQEWYRAFESSPDTWPTIGRCYPHFEGTLMMTQCIDLTPAPFRYLILIGRIQPLNWSRPTVVLVVEYSIDTAPAWTCINRQPDWCRHP